MYLVSLAVAGCTGGPSKLTPAKLNPAKVGGSSRSIRQRQRPEALRNGVKGCPGLILANFDTDKDGSISAAEIEQHIELWLRTESPARFDFRRGVSGATHAGSEGALDSRGILWRSDSRSEGLRESGSVNFDTGDGFPGSLGHLQGSDRTPGCRPSRKIQCRNDVGHGG